jgi:hypothetical protein
MRSTATRAAELRAFLTSAAYTNEYLPLLNARIEEATVTLTHDIPADQTARLRAQIVAWRDLRTVWPQILRSLTDK